MFKVNNKTPEEHQWHCFDVFIVNFELFHTCFSVSTVDFEQVFAENKMNIFPKSALLH